MDGTLISEDELNVVYPRPHLKIFLRFCFECFETVSIWTNACEKWFQIVNRAVFIPLLDEINEENETDYKFHVVYTEKRSSNIFIQTEGFYSEGYYQIKRLRKLWRHKSLPHTRRNTIVIDDTPSTYEENYGNGIPIKAWHWKSVFDEELLYIAQYLTILIRQFKEIGNIRHIEKRWWKDEIPSLKVSEKIEEDAIET